MELLEKQITVQKQIQQIEKVIDNYLIKFDKDNPKPIQNQILKQLKKLKQIPVPQKDQIKAAQLRRLIKQKQQKIKYSIEMKKMIAKPEWQTAYIQKLTYYMREIEDKMLSFSKNGQKDKKKRTNYQKNIEFLKYHLKKLEKINEMLLQKKRVSIQTIQKLFLNYLQFIFTSHEDINFQSEIEQIYNSIEILANIKQEQFSKKSQLIDPSLSFIQASFQNCPRLNDYYPLKQTKQKQSRNSIFPEYQMVDLSAINEMSNQTLFFIFYYQKNTIQQYFAAKQLNKRNWRYHIKYYNWFRRFDQPTFENPEYEKGSYLFFDYEKFWGNRRKSDFTLKYHYLQKLT